MDSTPAEFEPFQCASPERRAYVDELMGDVRRLGDPATGRKVFHVSVTGCIACHQAQGISQLGALAEGPDLSAEALDFRRS